MLLHIITPWQSGIYLDSETTGTLLSDYQARSTDIKWMKHLKVNVSIAPQSVYYRSARGWGHRNLAEHDWINLTLQRSHGEGNKSRVGFTWQCSSSWLLWCICSNKLFQTAEKLLQTYFFITAKFIFFIFCQLTAYKWDAIRRKMNFCGMGGHENQICRDGCYIFVPCRSLVCII